MKAAEDRYVDMLFTDAISHDVSTLSAEFPRTYIDPNRHIEDIDPLLLNETWPTTIRRNERTERGIGLIRRLVKGIALYKRKLSVAAVQKRIDDCYTPYHNALNGALNQHHKKFGKAYHMDIHSMDDEAAPPANQMSPLNPFLSKADFEIGDRDGSSCEPAFRHIVKDTLSQMGYRVVINRLYKGVEIIERYGQPDRGIHSLQLEINKSLYLNEKTQEKSKDFGKVKADMDSLITIVSNWVKQQIEP